MKLKKNLLFIGLLCSKLLVAEASNVHFKVQNPTENCRIILSLNSSDRPSVVAINEKGEGTFNCVSKEAEYITVSFGRDFAPKTIYLEPQSDLTLAFDAKTFDSSFSISGQPKEINAYLSNNKIKSLSYKDTDINEPDYIQMLDAMHKKSVDYLKSCKLDQAFTQKETERLKYLVYQNLVMYPSNHRYVTKDESYTPSSTFTEKLRSLFKEKPELLNDKSYKTFITHFVYNFAKGEPNSKSLAPIARYIDENINNQAIREFLMKETILNSISYSGVDNQEEAIALFKKVVKDENTLNRFNQLCSKWEKLKIGSPSPTFNCQDINGNTVTLDNLKGKYLYIDIWSTSCGYCILEFPALKELEKEYTEKGICFVSISCDQSKKLWEDMVKKENLTGVQLLFSKNDSFLRDYMVYGIPRFIILDREGKIIDANATRPSDKRTSKTFDALLKR